MRRICRSVQPCFRLSPDADSAELRRSDTRSGVEHECGRVGMTYYFAGQYDRALEYFRRALDLDTDDYVAHLTLVWFTSDREV